MTRAVFFVVGLLAGLAIGYDAGRRAPAPPPCPRADLAALEAQVEAAIVRAQRVEDVLAERLRLTGRPNPRPSGR